MATIFLVDDEESILKLVEYNFRRAGFEVETATEGFGAYQTIISHPGRYQVIVLDWMLPGLDGMEICRKLRQDGVKTPIILLTARDEEVDLVLGLEMGADDYVTKPFSPRELIARTKAVIRRTNGAGEGAVETTATSGRVLRAGEVTIDLARHEVSVRGNVIDLTPKEFDLLKYLVEHVEHVLSRDQLLDSVWGYTIATDTRIVDVHVSHLRDKIEHDPKSPQFIKTIRGVGYKFTLTGGR